MTMLTLTTGTAFIMWLGEQITERGIGNGMSLIIFTGIVVGLPRGVADLLREGQARTRGARSRSRNRLLLVDDDRGGGVHRLVERGERRIPVQYAKRVVGRRVMGGQSTHLPLQVNAGGVIPVIFASSILTFPQTAGLRRAQNNRNLAEPHARMRCSTASRCTTCCTSLGIIFFCFFYVSIIFNPNEVADNMRKYGGFIPGIRPGKRTADYMNDILTTITVVGALYLIILSLHSRIMISGIHLQHLPLVATGSMFDSFPQLAARTAWA